ILDDISAQAARVTVTVPDSVTLSGNTGVFPLTVINDLDEPVNVALEIKSANVDRLRIEPVAVREVPAGERVYIDVTAQAAANGKVPIDVQLIAADGSPIGPSRQTVVNATDYGTIGWVIVAVAGVLFAGAIVRKALRDRGQSEP